MLDELVRDGRITVQQKDMYLTYTQSEHGQRTLSNMMYDTFMDEPPATQFTGVDFAFLDGRRSVCRDIQRTIKIVETELTRGLSNDDQ